MHLDSTLGTIKKEYANYKGNTDFAAGFYCLLFKYMFKCKILSIENKWKNRLHYVRIYFDTPTFDRITKDRAAKVGLILLAR